MKEPYRYRDINLLGAEELAIRLEPLCAAMHEAAIDAALISSPVSVFYLTGRVFFGFIYVVASTRSVRYLVRRPNILSGEGVHCISKPGQIPETLAASGQPLAGKVALELGIMPFDAAVRLAAAIGIGTPEADISPLLRKVRAVKTAREQEMLRLSGTRQTGVYESIPQLYREGMSDIEFQIEIERRSRLAGCLGQFRVGGIDMEIFMGNVLTGKNADTPSPYDFAMGGAGMDPSLPVGADGTIIKPGLPVMVDVNGNYTGYMTDMTRTFSCGDMPAQVVKANELSCAICAELARMMIPGTPASSLYHRAVEMAAEAGMEEFFMGHRRHAGFVGHGVGIEINELPVIAPRSKDILAAGNVIALEPKFVLPEIGAVGIENTYIVTPDRGGERITGAPEDIVPLD